MAKIIDLPKLSPTMEEGTLVRWAKAEGERVEIDELLAEVETDKATMEFRSFDRGTLAKRLAAEGSVVALGQPVAIFAEPGEDIAALLREAAARGAKGAADATPASSASSASTAVASAGGPASAASVPTSAGERATERAGGAPPRVEHTGPAALVAAPTKGLAGVVLLPPARAASGDGAARGAPGGPASPRVRRVARERGIDLARVHGSGEHGRVTLADLEGAQRVAAALGAGSPTPAVAAVAGALAASLDPEDTVRPASSMRKTIARRLTEAKRDVPHFYLEADVAFDALVALREELNDGLEKDARVSVTDLLVRACALALREVPAANASWIDGAIVQHHRADISVAVAIDDGLVTPVLRAADRKGVRSLGAELRELAARARARKLKPEEMTGGVFSLSNLGMYGVDRFSAVLNPPEGMILAVGATREVPVVRNGALAVGKRCALTLSCDHRVVDGALGAQYLKALRALLERPVRVLA